MRRRRRSDHTEAPPPIPEPLAPPHHDSDDAEGDDADAPERDCAQEVDERDEEVQRNEYRRQIYPPAAHLDAERNETLHVEDSEAERNGDHAAGNSNDDHHRDHDQEEDALGRKDHEKPPQIQGPVRFFRSIPISVEEAVGAFEEPIVPAVRIRAHFSPPRFVLRFEYNTFQNRKLNRPNEAIIS